MRLDARRWLPALLAAGALDAQTTQAILRGRVTDSLTGLGVPGASVVLRGAAGEAAADRAGYYSLPLLSPGTYVLEASAASYQPGQVHGVALAVAALVDVDIVLRPLGDVWEQGEYKSLLPVGNRGLAPMFGPDIDRGRTALVRFPSIALAGQDAALSSVISSDFLLHLPLAGRDAYSMLVMMPGVTADAGTARGVGVAVNGQRPSASNFLLDGVEHDNYVLGAPLGAVAPEAISEYRISSNNFSAEFGRTSGVLANAVTRAGGAGGWHGMAYTYLRNELLDANGFQQNRLGVRRAPLRQWQPGGAVGGAIAAGTFVSGSLERLRTRTRLDPVEIAMPTTFALRFFRDASAGRSLLAKYAALLPRSETEIVTPVSMEPPSSLDRWLGVARVDRNLDGGRLRAFTRFSYTGVARPDFIWSPYPDYIAPLNERTFSPMVSVAHNPRPNWTGEYRVAFSRDRLAWDRPHPELPAYVSADGAVLPGSLAFYSYGNTASHVEANTSQTWISPRHAWKWGGGLLARRMGGALTAGRDGRYLFQGVGDFLQDWPERVEAMVARGGATLGAPDYARHYTQWQEHAFIQDAWRWTSRALLSLGARYESFGAPSGVYSPDRNNFAVRAALSWRPQERGKTLVKAAYGVFYDRPFDNLWQNVRSNAIQLAGARIGVPDSPILSPLRDVLRSLPRRSIELETFPEPLVIAAKLRDAYVHSSFAGVSRRLGENAEIEVTAMAALGRALITTDKIGRERSVSSYRANQGTSSYWGESVTYRRRGQHLTMQASYTWSHSTDVQSEALTGDFFDLSFTRDVTQAARLGVSAFSREGDPRGDRGPSDFDQRHNATVFLLWQPARLRGWRLGAMAALRSGFPYSVFAIPHDEGEVFYNLRATYVPGDGARASPVAGGVQRLRPEEFRNPRPGSQGNTGRNAFAGPGFFNVDASLEREIRARWMPEGHRMVFRVEAFNALNHANLGTPDNQIGSDQFGVALRGRLGRASSFPAVAPFVESGRQAQLLLRYAF